MKTILFFLVILLCGCENRSNERALLQEQIFDEMMRESDLFIEGLDKSQDLIQQDKFDEGFDALHEAFKHHYASNVLYDVWIKSNKI